MSNTLQSRAETKARKTVLGLGLKPVNSVERVVLTIGPYRKVYAIHHPQVFKSDNSDTYIVFGELTFENDGSVESSYLCCEQTSTVIMGTGAEQEEEGTSTTDAEDSQEMAEEEEMAAVSDIEEEDIQIVIQQSYATRAEAIEALRHNENDVVNAIMDLTL